MILIKNDRRSRYRGSGVCIHLRIINVSALTIALVVLAKISLFAETVQVALPDIRHETHPLSVDVRPAEFTAVLQAILSGEDDFAFVEREELERILHEQALMSMLGADSAAAFRAGRLAGADLLVEGRLRRGNSDALELSFEIIDNRRAGQLAFATVDVATDPRGRLAMRADDFEAAATTLRQALRAADENLRGFEGRAAVAPLFLKNTGLHPRLNRLEQDFFRAVADEADRRSARVLRFSRALEAYDEAGLMIVGLASAQSEDWLNVADLYIWGEFAEVETTLEEAPFDEVEVDISLFVWNGVDPLREMRRRVRVPSLGAAVGEMVAEAFRDIQVQTEAAPVEYRREIAESLALRASRLRAQLRLHDRDFVISEIGREWFLYGQHLLEAAVFFDPLERSWHSELLATAWAPYHPLAPAGTIGGMWDKVRAHAVFARRFPVNSEGEFSLDAAIAVLDAIDEAVYAFREMDRYALSRAESYAHTRAMIEFLESEVQRVNGFAVSRGQDDSDWIREYNDAVLRMIFIDTTHPRGLTEYADVAYELWESLWPLLKPRFIEWRDHAPNERGHADWSVQDYAYARLRAVYRTFSREERWFEMMRAEMPDLAPTVPRSFLREHANPRRIPPEPPPVDRPWGEGRAELPGERLVRGPAAVREVDLWPEKYFDGLRFDKADIHRWRALHYSDGYLYVAETAERTLPASDGWKNDQGNHYVWAWEPSTRISTNLTRILGGHGGVNDLQVFNGRLWLALENEGVWEYAISSGNLKKVSSGEGLLSPHVDSVEPGGRDLFILGDLPSGLVLNRYAPDLDQWHDVAVPVALFAPGDSARSDRIPLMSSGNWLLALGASPMLYEVDEREWSEVDELGLPRDETGARIAASNLVWAPGEEGFWVAGESEVVFLRPGSRDASRRFAAEGDIRAMAFRNEVLWVAVEIEPRAEWTEFESAGVASHIWLLAFDSVAERWIGHFPLPLDRADSMVASDSHVWIAGNQLVEVDLQTLFGTTIEAAMHPVAAFSPSVQNLERASWYGDLVAIERLLDDGTSPDGAGEWSPLMLACLNGRRGASELLLNRGADPNAGDRTGWLPLRIAAARGDVGMVRLLISHGAEVNHPGVMSRIPPFEPRSRMIRVEDRYPNLQDAFRPPQPPRNVSVEPIDSASVRVTWIPGSGDETVFTVYRGLDDIANFVLGRVSGYTTQFIDQYDYRSPLRPGRTYSWRVEAVNAAGRSRSSELVTLTMPPASEFPPSDTFTEFERMAITRGDQAAQKPALGRTALMDASRKGHAEVVAALLGHGADPNAADVRSDTAAHLASRYGHGDVVRLLVEGGADTGAIGWRSKSLVELEYERRRDYPLFVMLLEKGVTTEVATDLLFTAIEGGWSDEIDLILEHGADPAFVTPNGVSSVYTALLNRRYSIARRFLELGFDPNTRYFESERVRYAGEPVLIEAVETRQHDIMESILSSGMAPREIPMIASPLAEAVQADDPIAVEMLLRYGADPEQGVGWGPRSQEVRNLFPTEEVRTSARPASMGIQQLHVGPWAERISMVRSEEETEFDRALLAAAARGDTAAVQAALNAGALIDAKDDSGWSPLIHAFQNEHFDVASLLIETGATLNIVTAAGHPVISFAIAAGDLDLVREMLELGASPNLFSGRANSPMRVAIDAGMEATLLLLDYGGSVNGFLSPNRSHPRTPLMEAARRGDAEMVRFLLARGAYPNAHTYLLAGDNRPREDYEVDYPNAVFHAALAGSVEIIQILIEAGADPFMITRYGDNALYWAIDQGHLEAVIYLHDFGLRHPDAIQTARQRGFSEIEQFLALELAAEHD